MPSLFDPITLGAITCPNRIVMAPLTRGRATREHVPTEIMKTYYAQRASAGLIITEATGMSRQGLGWPYAVQRLAGKAELTPDVQATWYSQGPEGYIDYPEMEALAAE